MGRLQSPCFHLTEAEPILMKKSVGMEATVAGFARIEKELNSGQSSYEPVEESYCVFSFRSPRKGFGIGIMFGLGLYCCVLLGCDRQPTQIPSRHAHAEPTIPSPPSPSGEDTVAAATSNGTQLKLIVQVDGFANDKGICRVAVYLGKAHFNDLEYAIAKESTAVLDSKAEVVLAIQLPAAKDRSEIAVSAYHDENDNSRLDKNSFGIPIERYGFSSNPKRGFGPPKFNEAAIDLDAAIVQNESGAKLVIPITIK